jgi:hypothetical protein
MHPEIRQQLAAARISEMIAEAEGWRLAHQARPAPGPPRTQADTERPAASTAPAGEARVPATVTDRADAELAR